MSRRRSGFSLLEVLVATGVLLACVVLLMQLSYLGRRRAETAEVLSTAQRLCQNKLNEMLCGVSPITAVDNQPLEDETDWTFSVEITPISRGLSAVRVSVAQPTPDGQQGQPKFALVRWVRSPAGYNTLDELPGSNPAGDGSGGTAP